MPKATKKTAREFLMECIIQADADGYQQFEDEKCEVPDGRVPDNFWREGEVIHLQFGDRVFRVTVSIPRNPN